MSNPPAFSHKAMIAKAVLYSPYNSFTLFVEDISLEHLYLTILNRMFPDLTIRRVFPLGGRDFVHKAYYSYINNEIVIPGTCFFLSDLDLEPYIGQNLINDDLFIYLEEYSIENYLIDEVAFSKALQWKKGQIAEEIRTGMQFAEWLESVISAFCRLHICFVMCRRHQLGENAQLSPYLFIENTGFLPDNSEIEKYIDGVKNLYGVRSISFEEEFRTIEEMINEYTAGNIKAVISGKYLLASMYRFACNLCGKQVDKELLLALLVQHFDISNLNFMKDKILRRIS